jgi:hypothetical protein
MKRQIPWHLIRFPHHFLHGLCPRQQSAAVSCGAGLSAVSHEPWGQSFSAGESPSGSTDPLFRLPWMHWTIVCRCAAPCCRGWSVMAWLRQRQYEAAAVAGGCPLYGADESRAGGCSVRQKPILKISGAITGDEYDADEARNASLAADGRWAQMRTSFRVDFCHALALIGRARQLSALNHATRRLNGRTQPLQKTGSGVIRVQLSHCLWGIPRTSRHPLLPPPIERCLPWRALHAISGQ